MRLRNIKGSRQMIEQSKYVIHNPVAYKGKWKELFMNDNPIHIEIGMGKGQFIMQQAVLNPKINFIGIEKFDSVLVRALEKRSKEVLDNIYFVRFDARELLDIFACGEIDKIYLNFSDPWPKDRHARRRLTSKEFLSKYEVVLNRTGSIEFKTDNEALFDFYIEQVEDTAWKIEASTRDLHHDTVMSEGNIMTEYEQKFSSMGNPIYKMILRHAYMD